MRKKRIFGELELTILQVFRSREKLTVHEVLEVLGGDDKYTTIMTVMSRMVEKKMLMRQLVGHQYEYWINQSVQDSDSTILDHVKQKIFGGKAVSMASYLLKSCDDLSNTDLEEMEKLIQDLKTAKRQS